jgi:hypothetical protein
MRTLSLGAFVMTVGTAGACLDREARAGEPAALWRALQEQPVRGEAVVGFRASGVDRPPAPEGLRGLEGVAFVHADPHVPYAIVNLASPEALRALQARPEVTFVEPRYVKLQAAFSCPTGEYGGFQHLDPAWQVRNILDAPRFAPFHDYVPWHFADLTQPPGPLPFAVLPGFRGHRIVDAWRRRGGGRGARVAIVDTGVATGQPELAATCEGCASRFARGLSRGRTLDVFNVYDTDLEGDSCGHGTAAASAALAPLDARRSRRGSAFKRRPGRGPTDPSVVGVAWQADGASVRIDEDVFVNWTDVDRAVQGLRRAICGAPDRCAPHPRQVVSMAWGDIAEHSAIKEEIAHWARSGVLFLGAAGTGVTGIVGCRLFDEPLFPAAQTYPSDVHNPVLAVTCVNPNTGLRSDSVCKSFDLAGVWHSEFFGPRDDWPALSPEPGRLVNFGSSSGCVSTVAGIAALTWAAHPHESRDQIVGRLHASARFGNAETGSGVVDAFLAVGGLGNVAIQVSPRVAVGSAYELRQQRESGDGPFRFEWTDGSCDGVCDFDRATGTCQGPCPLVGTCAAGHPACESITRVAPAVVGLQQTTRLRVIDEGSLDPAHDLAVRTDVRTVCARTRQCDPDRQCGSIPDGCGGLLSCGRCLPGEFCDDGVCVCNGGLCL